MFRIHYSSFNIYVPKVTAGDGSGQSAVCTARRQQDGCLRTAEHSTMIIFLLKAGTSALNLHAEILLDGLCLKPWCIYHCKTLESVRFIKRKTAVL